MTTYELAQKQVSGNTAEINNALVVQKDHLLSVLSKLDDADDAQKFMDLCSLFLPLGGPR